MQWSKSELVWLPLLLIVGLGFFLRTYELHSWLHFELDQARDVRVIDWALQGGAMDLPLLGPRAGGTFLRLAPGFYWLEYVGAVIIGQAVIGSAAMVALFSTLTIPIFFYFIRRYFALPVAWGLSLLMAAAPFFVLYGRFAWNPNLVPFFSLLGFYALLRAVDDTEPRMGRWLLLAAFALGLGTHMHFLAFLALPTIAVLFLLIKRPRIALRFWVGAVGIVVLLYVPLILNEIATGGANAKEFVAALSEKSAKENHPLIEKAVRNVSEFSLHSVVISSGFEGASFPAIILSKGVIGSVCDARCDQGKWYGIVAIFLLGCASLMLIWRWHQESLASKKDFLLLICLWFGVTFLLFLPLSYGIAPRFFLINAPVFLVLFGLLLTFFEPWLSGRWKHIVIGGGLALLVFCNGYFLWHRFGELAHAGTYPVESAPDRILKEPLRVTLSQQEAIVDWMVERSQLKYFPVYLESESRYERSLRYLMEQRGLRGEGISISSVYREGVYVVVIRTQSNHDDTLRKYLPFYTVKNKTVFGTLTAIELEPKESALTAERQDFSQPEKAARSQVAPRYTLREFLTRSTSDTTVDESGQGDSD